MALRLTTLVIFIAAVVANLPAQRAGAEPDVRLMPIRHIESAWVSGPPMRKYEPLMMGGDFQRERIRQFRAFFPELESLDSANGIDAVDLPKKNRIRLLLRSKINGSYHFEFHVLEGDNVWTCGGKYFRLRKGWAKFLEKEFAWQEKDHERFGQPKILHVDRDNADARGFRIEVAAVDQYKQFAVFLKPELAEKFGHAAVSLLRDGEVLLVAAAASKETDDGQLRLAFNINPKIAADVRFSVWIAEKPRPISYRVELQSFLANE